VETVVIDLNTTIRKRRSIDRSMTRLKRLLLPEPLASVALHIVVYSKGCIGIPFSCQLFVGLERQLVFLGKGEERHHAVKFLGILFSWFSHSRGEKRNGWANVRSCTLACKQSLCHCSMELLRFGTFQFGTVDLSMVMSL
jgi:hypothetical protein